MAFILLHSTVRKGKPSAMRMAFFNDCRVSVFDEKAGETIRDFDDPKHR